MNAKEAKEKALWNILDKDTKEDILSNITVGKTYCDVWTLSEQEKNILQLLGYQITKLKQSSAYSCKYKISWE